MEDTIANTKKEGEVAISKAKKEVENAYIIDRLEWKNKIAILKNSLQFQQQRMVEKQKELDWLMDEKKSEPDRLH